VGTDVVQANRRKRHVACGEGARRLGTLHVGRDVVDNNANPTARWRIRTSTPRRLREGSSPRGRPFVGFGGSASEDPENDAIGAKVR
jgi:hypothetical protein